MVPSSCARSKIAFFAHRSFAAVFGLFDLRHRQFSAHGYAQGAMEPTFVGFLNVNGHLRLRSDVIDERGLNEIGGHHGAYLPAVCDSQRGRYAAVNGPCYDCETGHILASRFQNVLAILGKAVTAIFSRGIPKDVKLCSVLQLD
jgi:hypothetical protein